MAEILRRWYSQRIMSYLTLQSHKKVTMSTTRSIIRRAIRQTKVDLAEQLDQHLVGSLPTLIVPRKALWQIRLSNKKVWDWAVISKQGTQRIKIQSVASSLASLFRKCQLFQVHDSHNHLRSLIRIERWQGLLMAATTQKAPATIQRLKSIPK